MFEIALDRRLYVSADLIHFFCCSTPKFSEINVYFKTNFNLRDSRNQFFSIIGRKTFFDAKKHKNLKNRCRKNISFTELKMFTLSA